MAVDLVDRREGRRRPLDDVGENEYEDQTNISFCGNRPGITTCSRAWRVVLTAAFFATILLISPNSTLMLPEGSVSLDTEIMSSTAEGGMHLRQKRRRRRRRLYSYQSNPKRKHHATSYAQRHPNDSQNPNSYSGYYSYDDDEDEIGIGRRKPKHHKKQYTDLGDVGLCLLTSLGWAVWMIRSFFNSKRAERAASGMDVDERFWAQKDSLLKVRGHVLQVFTELDDLGVPKHTAVIDYVIEKEQTRESIQIRKHFETQQPLEQGFANVDLLVLPEEPKQALIKEDFDQQIQQEEKLERQRRHDEEVIDDESKDDVLAGILEGRYCDRKCQRLTTSFAALLVLISLAGTVQVVCFMEESEQWKGWIAICLGATLLLPAAIMCNRLIRALIRMQEPSEKQGYIVQSLTSTGTVVTNPKEELQEDFMGEACMPPSFVDEMCQGDYQRRVQQTSSYIVPEMSGCYFVQTHKRGCTGYGPRSPRNLVSSSMSGGGGDDDQGSSLYGEALAEELSSTSTVSSISNEDPIDRVGDDDIWSHSSNSKVSSDDTVAGMRGRAK